MRKSIYLLSAVILISCNSNKSEKNAQGDATDSELATQNVDAVESAANAELIPHPMIDNKNQVMGHMTFPANWKLHNEPGKAAFSGPGGIFVYNIPMRNFAYTNDPMMRQAYAQAGGKLRMPLSGAEIIRQDFEPIARKEGSKLIGIHAAADIAKSDGSVQDMMYRIGPSYAKYDAVVSEWEDKDGNPYAIILHITVSDLGNMVSWNYYGQGLDVPKDKYESAKKTLVAGLTSLQYNPRYFDQYNQKEMNRESSSWAAHNQRMAQRQQQFDAQQAIFKDKSESINQSIMASYESRNASSDRMHNRFVNYIKDENTVINKSDGQKYQVQTGNDHYWMNDQGQYIGTNDPNYDPNRNQGTQNQTWNEAQQTD